MGKLYVVRHADAGSRGHASKPDEDRELSERGWRQAEALSDVLADLGITRLLTSPFVRCVQTLEPLANAIGLPVETDERLSEGAGAKGARAVAAEVCDTAAVLCSHGDVIPDLLEQLVAHGIKLKGGLRWQKASTWVLTCEDGHITKGRYLPPPS